MDYAEKIYVGKFCAICGEPMPDPGHLSFMRWLEDDPGDAPVEVIEVATGKGMVVHSEPCSYEHGDKYRLA